MEEIDCDRLLHFPQSHRQEPSRPLPARPAYDVHRFDARDDSADLAEKVAWILEAEINPGLASHGGMVTLETITEANEVVLRFGGGCHGCGMVSVTLQQGIEKTLKEHFPEVTAIIDATDHATGDNPYYK